MTDKRILVDSGATDNFIDPRLITRLGLGTRKLERPRKIWNIDGTNNQAGMLTQYVDLSIRTGKREETMRFLVTSLGSEDLILGYPWLTTFEPQFNWTNGVIDTSYLPIVIRSLDWKTLKIRPTIAAVPEEEPMTIIQRAHVYDILNQESNAWANISTELAQKVGQYTKKVEIPPHYQQFAKVFDEEASHRLPQHQPWDHTIDLKPNAPSSLNCKIYLLTM
jgi:Aspartyl protease